MEGVQRFSLSSSICYEEFLVKFHITDFQWSLDDFSLAYANLRHQCPVAP